MLLLSTACFPTIEYILHIVKNRHALVEIHETFPKQTWRNRYRILTGNGPLSLSIPVEKPFGNKTKTHKVLLSSHSSWRQNHWKTIHSAYRNSPYFIHYCQLVEDLLFSKVTNYLYQYNANILSGILSEMGIKAEIGFTEDFIKDNKGFTDLRFSLNPKIKNPSVSISNSLTPYYQVFADRMGFQGEVSVLDLVFHLGPDVADYLLGQTDKV